MTVPVESRLTRSAESTTLVTLVSLVFSVPVGICAGIYLVEQLCARIPYWALPVTLQLMTMIIAFSTGTSWGTYAIAFPLAMPLAWTVAQAWLLGWFGPVVATIGEMAPPRT